MREGLRSRRPPKEDGITELKDQIEERLVHPRRTPQTVEHAFELIDRQSRHLQHLELSLSTLKASITNEIELLEQDVKQMNSREVAFQQTLQGDEVEPLQRWSVQLQNKYGSGKVFYLRDSLLTEMLEIKDFGTIYNIFLAALPLLLFGLMSQTYAEKGIIVDFRLLTFAFGKMDVVAAGWLVLFSMAMAGYVFKYIYRTIGQKFGMFVQHLVYVAYQAVMALFATWWTLGHRLPPASGLIIMCEQVRLFMKLHSFYRCHMKQSGKDTQHQDLETASFSHYLHFLFCPTLLYRTSYPRTPVVRWTRVLINWIECVALVLYMYVLFERFLMPIVTSPSYEDLPHLVTTLFNSMLPGLVVFVFGFFGFLHCWLNIWSELMQFGDREFYKDWWNAGAFPEYYRKWNGVVYDWIHAYAYVDLVRTLEKRAGFSKGLSRGVASIFVIEASAVIHEYILACAFGYWLPVLWAMYGGAGVLFMSFKSTRDSRRSNIFLWLMLLMGCGMMIVVYAREYVVRQSIVDANASVMSAKFWREFSTAYSVHQLVQAIYKYIS